MLQAYVPHQASIDDINAGDINSIIRYFADTITLARCSGNSESMVGDMRFVGTCKGKSVFILVILLVSISVACGSAAPATSEPTTTMPTTDGRGDTPTSVPTATPPPGGGSQSAGTLTIALTDFGFEVPVGWRESAVAKHYMRFIYDSLVGLNDAGELDDAWGLAESWEVGPNGRDWTFHLKQGIPFHNGDEFTAQDVKFTFGKLMQPESVTAYKDRLTAFMEGPEQDIHTPDSHTLVVNLTQPNIWFEWDLTDSQGLLGMPQPKGYTEEVGDEMFAKNPVGTGPYRFMEQRIGDFMELEAVQDHWREGTPAVKTVVFRKISEESTRIAAIKSNEVDAISVSRENAPEVEGSGLKIFTQAGASVVGFYFHQQWDPVPIADERVRQALNLAVNRDELCEFVFGGLCRPGIVYPVPNNMPVTQGLREPYPYDPDQARQLLEDAGYGDGFEITINSYPRADVPEGPRMIEALAGYFDEVGVKANIVATEYTKYREGRLARNISGQMGYLGAPIRPFPGFIGLMRTLNHSEGQFTSTQDPELDRLIDATERTLDPQEAEELYQEYYTYLYDHYIHLTLLDLDIPYAANDKVPDDWDLSVRSWEPNWLDITRPR